MKISHAWLQTYFKEKIPSVPELAELFNAHAFEVEGLEKSAVGNDEILDVKVLPDRAHYALCHRGVAREVSVITSIGMENTAAAAVSAKASIAVPKVSVDVPEMCSRYMARRIENVSVSGKLPESPTSLKEKLESVGQRSINAIVDAMNFVMLDIGQPLHAFDADKLEGEITVRNAKEGEKIILLDGSEAALITSDLVIADNVGAIAIAGVKGGKRAAVGAETKAVIIESANFNATSVRRTATRLNLRNDASKRFENALSPELCSEAMERVTAMVLSICTEAAAGPVADIYPKPAQPWSVEIKKKYIDAIIGVSIPIEEIKAILERMSCKVTESDGTLSVTPPYDRLDITIPEDIADEVARIYGYDKIPAQLPPQLSPDAAKKTLPDKTFYYAEKAKNILVARGYSETLLYALVPKGHFEIAYPLASDKRALRESILPEIEASLIQNTRNADLLELDTIKIFEIGNVFPKTGEHSALSLGVSLVKKQKGISAETILAEDIKVLEKELGITISAKITKGDFGAALEIDFTKAIHSLPEPLTLIDLGFKPLSRDIKYKPFSPYPFSVRDVAVFVPEGVTENDVRADITNAAGNLLTKLRIFDVFKKKMPDGTEKTSFAFRLVLQSNERTLTEEELVATMARVTESLQSHANWQVR